MRRPAAAFTLVEVLLVLVIVATLLGIGLNAAARWGRGERLGGSARMVRHALGGARQWAVTHGVTAYLHCANRADGRACFALHSASEGLIGTTNYLAQGVVFVPDPPAPVAFNSGGACAGTNGTRYIVIEEATRTQPLAVTVAVARATGIARIME